jgi:23S rRNA (adenine2503-C2)-methyltransferase
MSFLQTANNLDTQKYRIKQLIEAKYKHGLQNMHDFKLWPKELKDKYSQELESELFSLEALKRVVSASDNTVKVLFARKSDQAKFETVLMQHEDGRNTVCVSCMIGCPVNCSFCATGKLGFKANLTCDEIVDQVLFFVAELAPKLQRITNVVFMGMGEPLLNLQNVKEAISIMTNPEYLGLGDRRITVSTSGYVPQLLDLVESGFKGNIAISLHSALQVKREKLMPVAKVYPLTKLFEVLDNYTATSKRRVTYEYILLQGFNDGEDDAMALVHLLKNKLAHVNLIPYNSISGSDFERPSRNKIFAFKNLLSQNGINTTIRVTMGDDENAACGQLAYKN